MLKVSKRELDRRMACFEESCKKSGAKLTHQRMEIFREVARTSDHPYAEKVFRGVRRRIPMISLDTVYRTLWWLKDMGLVTMLDPAREGARFDANLMHHHHFVCIHCGITRDFMSDKLDRLELPDSVLSIGHAEKTEVEVKGICQKCAKFKKRGAKPTKHL